MNLSERVRRNLAEGGEITAITFNDAAYSWNTVRGLVEPLSAALKAADPDGQFAAIVARRRPAPVKVKVVAAIPMTQLLKVSRPQLRELLAD
jgi:hypothetical protein